MKNIFPLLLFISLLYAQRLQAQDSDLTTPSETLEEVVVTSFKEGGQLYKLPSTVSLISSKQMERKRIESMRDVSAFVPNLFIPDYGSKLTSAIYIRGVGSRIGGSAIGLYVDDVPYLDKTAYDFDFFDIKRMEVLSGPQGTLYGRNSMGGLINIYTLTAWDFQGTKAKISAGNLGWAQAQLMHYGKIGEKLAFSLGGNYRAQDGFVVNHDKGLTESNHSFNAASLIFPNRYNYKTMGAVQTAALRGSLSWRANERLTATYNASYEYSDQYGYAYGRYNPSTKLPDSASYNDPTFYSRHLLNQSLRFEYKGEGFKLASTTGFQHLSDKLDLDQDFTSAPIFTLLQEQRLNAWTQELVARSANSSPLQWVGGIFGFKQSLNTLGPVTFKEAGIKSIQATFDKLYADGQSPRMVIQNNEMLLPGSFKNPTYGGALFYQASYSPESLKGFTATAGLRLDYEKAELDYFSSMAMDLDVYGRPGPPSRVKGTDTLKGNEQMDFRQLLPKFALQYSKGQHLVYASVSKGYKAGGYNIQMFSDLINTSFMKKYNRTAPPVDLSVGQAVSYRPEYSWNYELGWKASLLDHALTANLSLFYLDIRDQQIAEFAANGQGRMIKNAGRSCSKGVELQIQARPFKQLTGGVSYGYTHNTFTDYSIKERDGSTTDYAGNHVPFAPQNTLAVNADYQIDINNRLIDRVIVSGQTTGVGRIYWTEANDVAQDFYMLLNSKLTVEKANMQLSIWGRNLTGTDYMSFYFKTFGTAFGQLGRPMQLGADLKITF